MDYNKIYGDPTIPAEPRDLPPLPDGLSTKEQFKAMVPEAVKALRRVINNTKASDAATISAVSALLDRAEGKQAASADAGADNRLEITIMRQCPNCQAVEHG